MDNTDLMMALQNMSDEDLQRLMQAANAPSRSAYVERQLQQAQDVAPMGHYSTPGGALFGGMASALRQGGSALQQKQLRGEYEKQQALMEDPHSMRSIMGATGAGGGAGAAGGVGGSAMGGLPLGAAGLTGSMGGGAPMGQMSKQQLLIQLLRAGGGAGDLSGLGGLG